MFNRTKLGSQSWWGISLCGLPAPVMILEVFKFYYFQVLLFEVGDFTLWPFPVMNIFEAGFFCMFQTLTLHQDHWQWMSRSLWPKALGLETPTLSAFGFCRSPMEMLVKKQL